MPLYEPAAERSAASATPQPIGTAAVGTGTTDARDDHVHATGAGTPSTQAIGDAAATGTGPAASMTDHKHAMPAFGTGPAAVGTQANGSSASIARIDHVHATGAGTPSTQAFGDAAATGTGPAAAMTDHKHAMPANPFVLGTTPGAEAFGDTQSGGVATTASKNDHRHAMPAAPTTVANDTIWDTAGDLVQATGADAAAKLAITVPAANILNVVGVVNGETTWSVKSVHDGTAPVTQALGDAAAAGTSLLSAHRDHTHGMPTAASVKTSLAPVLPTVVAVTAEFTSTGAPTATLPTGHTTNDILVLVIQSSNETITAPAGYAQAGPQNGIGAAATALSSRLGIFWKRDGGSESAPTIPDTGDHTYGFMVAIRGCPTTGDPFAFGGNNWKFTTSTTGTGPNSVTTVDNVLVIDIFAGNVDSASAEGSSVTNADLASVTEQFDDGTTDGTGGFLYMASGTKATAGPVGATTVTWANSSSDLATRLHFLASGTTQNQNASRGVDVQTFIGSTANVNDTWTKPTGARRVLVQAMAGGGGGSSGHTATTPAGGGGGGGGMYTERWYNADDLTATVTTLAGKGGAATSVAVDQAGNNGANSTFGSLLTSVAGTGASASASADGGNGGSGGGQTVPAATSVQTIASGELGTAGGNGTTTGVGGSPGERGGGGGASGTTAANATVAAGLSKYGGGGGGAGTNTGTLTGGAAGGGAAAAGTSPSTTGVTSGMLPYGGSGGTGGNATTAPGGTGGFPGGGGGGGGGNNAATQGAAGGHGCIVVSTYF